MGEYTNEKSLMVVQDNFLNKIKNFFSKAFFKIRGKGKYYEEYSEEEDTEERYNEKIEQQVGTQKQRRLFNFDAEDNDNWPGDVSMDENDEKSNDVNEYDDKDKNQDNNEYEQEEVSEACRERQELEQKLMNYYESIKKGI